MSAPIATDISVSGALPFLIVFILYKKKVHWSVWPSVILCVMGGYLLTNFYDASVRLGDLLVVIGAIFWSLHIIFIGEIVEDFDLPITVGLIQTFIVSTLSFTIGITYEDFIIENILNETYEILYAGILSGGAAFVLQLFGQRYVPAAPAAIIMSLEGVFATISAWIILNQILKK